MLLARSEGAVCSVHTHLTSVLLVTERYEENTDDNVSTLLKKNYLLVSYKEHYYCGSKGSNLATMREGLVCRLNNPILRW